MALIDLIEVSKKFGDKIILNETNFSVNEKERIAMPARSEESLIKHRDS